MCPVSYDREHSLNLFENGVLRAVFGPKSVTVIESWKNLHNGEHHNF
jgi:hypothetical protein